MKTVEDAKITIRQLETLIKKSAVGLEDKGAKLKQKREGLKRELEKKQLELANYEIDTSIDLKKSLQKSIDDEVQIVNEPAGAKALNWDAIKQANALVLPKHTGQRGLQTFGNQKEKVERGLNKIHGNYNTQPGEDETTATPEALKVELMAHQKTGLRWLLWREESRPRGGILADDMGLGKTLSMISLILAKLDEKENEAEGDDSDDETDDEGEKEKSGKEKSLKWKNMRKNERYEGGTLVVCPATLLGQWEGEFKSKVRRGYVEFTLHHGSKREIRPKNLAKWDAVFTTYNIVSSEFKDKGPLFRIKWNRVILDEAHIIRNHKTQISTSCAALNSR